MKPGYKTTEFWVSLATVVVTALVSITNPASPWAAVVSALAASLTATSYGAQRTRVKLGG